MRRTDLGFGQGVEDNVDEQVICPSRGFVKDSRAEDG